MTMNYLDAFIVGSAGPTSVSHILGLALRKAGTYNYSIHSYSLVAPLYYGCIAMLALYVQRTYKSNLRTSLLITSLISIILVPLAQVALTSVGHPPYPNLDLQGIGAHTLTNSMKHLANINIVMYYLFRAYTDSYWWRAFIIASSVISYLIGHLAVIAADKKGRVNFDYRVFAVMQPFSLGFGLVLALYVFQACLGWSLAWSLVAYTLLERPITMTIVKIGDLYRQTPPQKLRYYAVGLAYSALRSLIYYPLLAGGYAPGGA